MIKRILIAIGLAILLSSNALAADTFKILCQSNPSAATSTDCYTVPASTSAVVSTIIVANRSTVATSFRVSFAIAGAALADSQYIAFDIPIGANEVVVFSVGAGLATTDKVRVYATLATLTFTVLGMEVT